MVEVCADKIQSAIHSGWSPRDDRPIWEWARENIILPASGYAIPGNFHIEKSRYLIKPLEDFKDDSVRSQTIYKATQTGGSLVGDICVTWAVKNRPGPIMVNMQTDPVAKAHAGMRMFPVIKACKTLEALIPEDRHSDNKQEIIFRNGNPLYVQGPSIGNLQSKSIRISINDEIWIWEPGRLKEAHARVDAFKRIGTSKVLNISQAGVEGDDMDLAYRDGDQSIWNVQCDKCNHYMPPRMTGKREDGTAWGMRWDKRDGGDGFTGLRFECRACGHPMLDSEQTRARWNLTGKYVPMNPGALPSVKSYHWNSIIVKPWDGLVADWLAANKAKARGAIIPLMQIVQKELCEPWSEDMDQDKIEIRTSDYSVDSEWDQERFRFMTVDVQQDCFWIIIRAWAANGDSRLILFKRLLTWNEVREHQVVNKVRDHLTFIDSGYETQKVYQQCVIYGWCALKGEDRREFSHTIGTGKNVRRLYAPQTKGDPGAGTVSQGRKYCPLFLWSNPTAKDILARLKDGRGCVWVAYPGVDNEYGIQINSEAKREVIEPRTGKRKWEWRRIGKRPNHGWDCEAMQVVGATMAGLIVDFDIPEPAAIPA